MVTVILIILIPLIAFISSYFTLKAYTLGLKHNVEVRQGIVPTEPRTVIQEVKEHYQEKHSQANSQQMNEFISEYLNGA